MTPVRNFDNNSISNGVNLTSVSFVIPMYNESQTIAHTVKELASVASELSSDYEIIIANDGSTDESGLVVDKLAKEDTHIKVVHLEKNTKFGGALRKGLKLAQKDIIIYTDSDLPIDASDIKEALSLLGNSDIVTAYSKIKKGENLKRVVISGVYNFLIQFLFKTDIKDINSGFKIYRKQVFDGMELISNSPFIDVEIFVKAIRKSKVIKQYPIIFKNREHGKSYISRPAVVLKTMQDMLKFKFSNG